MNTSETRQRVLGFTLALFIVASFLIPLLMSLALEDEDGEWVQISGSLVVLFSAILEIHQTLIKKPQEASSIKIEGRPALAARQISKIDTFFHGFAWTGIAVGTIVWGYGDLLFTLIFR